MKYVIACLSFFVFLNAYATQFRAGDNVTVGSDEMLEDDLFAGAQSVRIMGTLDGDLVAGARNIDVDGEISGDMIAGAELISITGRVADDLRLAAREIMCTGTVGSDALCFCQSLKLRGQSVIEKDLTVYAGEAEIEGDIGGKLSGGTGSMRISGRIGGDVEVSTGSLVILPSAEIFGDLVYTSEKPAEIREGSRIQGRVVHRPKGEEVCKWEKPKFPELKRVFHRLIWISRVILLVGSIIVGLVLVAVAPAFSRDSADTIKTSPWKCLGLGLLFLIVIPIAVSIVSLTVVGIPLGVIVVLLYLICLSLSSIVFGIFIGRSFFKLVGKEISNYWAVLLGMVVLFLLTLIPYVSWLIIFVVTLFGFGAIIISIYRKRKESRTRETL